MSWSLALVDGDLTKGPGNSLGTVTAQNKVIQDLSCWFYHPFGVDPMNPTYGSFLDSAGGQSVTIDNRTILLPENYKDLVDEEINRIINAYITNQGIKYNLQAQLYSGNIRITPDELLSSYTYTSTQLDTTLFVNISLSFAGGGSATIQVPVSNNSVA